MSYRGQGAFEYLLMLGGVVLVAVIVIVMVQSSAQGANNALGESRGEYNNFVTQGVKNTLGIPLPSLTPTPTSTPS